MHKLTTFLIISFFTISKTSEMGYNSHHYQMNQQLYRSFASQFPKEESFFKAIANNDLKKICELLPQIKLSVKNVFGETFLLEASHWGRIEILNLLLKLPEIKVDEKSGFSKKTALIEAMKSNFNKATKKETIQLLLSSGANPHTQDAQGKSFLDYSKLEKYKTAREAYEQYLKKLLYNEEIIQKIKEVLEITKIPENVINTIHEYSVLPQDLKRYKLKLALKILEEKTNPLGGPQLD